MKFDEKVKTTEKASEKFLAENTHTDFTKCLT